MYYTVTVNPAVDYYMTVPDFSVSDINRSQFETLSFGGKGINVSKMMKALGMESTALGFIAGFTGNALKNDLKKYGIPSDFVVLKDGFTRINVKIRGKSETDINAKGPEIPDFAVKSLIGKFKNLSSDDTVIVSGNVLGCISCDSYLRILEYLRNKGVRIVIDAEKKALVESLSFRPYLVKPNLDELCDAVGKHPKTLNEISDAASMLSDMGAKNVLVSLGKDGAMLLTEKREILSLNAPKINAVDTCGAGDSMIAGFLYGAATSPEYALRFAVACGSATASVTGIAGKQTVLNTLRIM